jgi:two-component system chemotaxis response regulator CheY
MSTTSLKVMVVEDSLITIGKLSTMLGAMGHSVVASVRTGAEALAAYRTHQPNVVTMDITMPDMDGVEATQQIVGEFPDAKIVMVTSHGQEKMVLAALNAGAKGYVLKPIRAEKLQTTIETACSLGR